MWLSETEIDILELFSKNIFLEVSINEISKLLKKHYRVVRVNILKLVKQNILLSRDYLGAKLISFNLDEKLAIHHLSYVEETKNYTILQNNIKILFEKNYSNIIGVIDSKPFFITNEKVKLDRDILVYTFEDLKKMGKNSFNEFITKKRLVNGAKDFYTIINEARKIEN